MNTSNHLSQEDLALFALQLLSEEESAAAMAHIQGCDVCRAQVAEFQGDLALYAMAVDTHIPADSVRERLLSRVAEEPRAAREEKVASEHPGRVFAMEPRGGEASRRAETRSRSTAVAWFGWALAAVFALAAVLQFQQSKKLRNDLASSQNQLAVLQANATTSQVALSTLGDPGALNVALRQPVPGSQSTPATQLPEGRAAYLPERGALVFVATNLQPLKPNKVYELWLLPAKEGMPPVPAASFRPDAGGNATVILSTAPRLVPVKGFGVTQEDDRSAPKQPTLPILLAGASKT